MSDFLLSSIHYFRIPVVNLKESIKWYSECLKLKMRFDKGELAVFEVGTGPLLVLVEADKDSRGHFLKDGQAEFSIGFTTSDIQSLHDYLVDQHVTVESIMEEEGHRFFYFYDLDGNKLQVHN
ncbi:VOC family protein [Halobacillus locisalis]|uniref:VOC family protein n=1 Tax=Halobacillus locisalis TaxID=220753 RepID=A0A838CVQ0_9BACI|nr:VOC family protein [Halobacillus locisalis]MBA2176040.1 VOC family protein [Halobacillus locisalis]